MWLLVIGVRESVSEEEDDDDGKQRMVMRERIEMREKAIEDE